MRRSESLYFRIPQTLDGFETAAREGGLVSEEAFAAATARPDLSSLRALTRSGRDGQVHASWDEDCCEQLYCFLHHLRGERGLKASRLQQVAEASSSAGLSATAEHPQAASNSHGTALSLSIFFTCQMLQHVEVSACTPYTL